MALPRGQGKLIRENNQKSKISCRTPFKSVSTIAKKVDLLSLIILNATCMLYQASSTVLYNGRDAYGNPTPSIGYKKVTGQLMHKTRDGSIYTISLFPRPSYPGSDAY